MKTPTLRGGGQRFTSGAGGIRTRVQTKHFQAFSMLSNTLFVGTTRGGIAYLRISLVP